jgi:hypothetical protein
VAAVADVEQVPLIELGRITRSFPAAGVGARAIAVYAEAMSADEGAPERLTVARERGPEGVACVDDAARAVVLYCSLWRRHGRRADGLAALGLLRFLAYMQDQDGRVVNFALDWSGATNRSGVTSYAGGPQWQARALHALAVAVATFGAGEWEDRYQRALACIDEAMPYLDIRAVCVLAALEHWRATGAAASAERAIGWSEQIASQRRDNCLLNAHGDASIHLWGHLQEAALAETGRALRRDDLVACARASADALLLPATDWARTAPHVLPFDISCVVAGLAAVARATGEPRFADGCDRAQRWFTGRNAAGKPVYDDQRHLVYDGIDEGRVSRNSGAESNIEGALALCADRRG